MSTDKNFDYKFSGVGLTEEEIKIGQQRFEEYCNQYDHLKNSSNSRLLEELVWKELVQDRFKMQVAEVTKVVSKGGKISAIPDHLQKQINDGIDQIIKLKEKLSMFSEQKEMDAFREWRLMETKAAEYRKSHPLSFKCTCPFCSRIFYLKRRTECYEEFQSPFAEDKVLHNRPLWKCFKDGKPLTQEDVAAILGVSSDYIPWLDEHVYGNTPKATEQIQELESAPEIPPEPLSA